MKNNENDLLIRIQQGDENAFEIIFKKYYANLVKYAKGFVGTIEESEDLVEDTFFWIWEKRSYIRINSSLKAYLFTITYHRCINYLEKNKRHQHYVETNKFLKKQGVNDEIQSDIITDELQSIINNSIERLPAECRKIFKLNRIHELKYREIADKLGISITTVKTQMSRALEKLRKDLKNYL